MMPRPKGGYRTADGERVPGVTTICEPLKDYGALIHWAWQCGVDGKDYRQLRDDAASAGTLAHDMVDGYITRHHVLIPATLSPDIVEKATRSYDNFRAWKEQNKLEIVATEQTMISERYRYGGTMDGLAVASISEKLALLDWKTSNRVYETYLAQLAAYGQLWNENNPDRPITGGFHLCRFSKDHGDFSHYYWAELDDAWTAFKHARALYELKTVLKKRVA